MLDERFARQYRYEPPPEFPLASPCTGIVHHLSGPNRYAHTQTSLNCSVGCWCKYPNSHFHCAYRFGTRILAHMLDSLVRVSRRVEGNHLVIIVATGKDADKEPTPIDQTRRSQSKLGSHGALSPARRQATMSPESSSSSN